LIHHLPQTKKLKIFHRKATSEEDIDKTTEEVNVIVSIYRDKKSDPDDALRYVKKVIILT